MPMGIKIPKPMNISIPMPQDPHAHGIKIPMPICILILMPMGIRILMPMGFRLRREREGASLGYVETFWLSITSKSSLPLLARCQIRLQTGHSDS